MMPKDIESAAPIPGSLAAIHTTTAKATGPEPVIPASSGDTPFTTARVIRSARTILPSSDRFATARLQTQTSPTRVPTVVLAIRAAISQPAFTAPTIARKSGRCVGSGTIPSQKQPLAEPSSKYITRSALSL